MKNKRFNELAVCGIEAVKALERTHPEAISRLYFTSDRAPHFGGLCKKLAQRKCPYNCVQDAIELEKLSGTVHHQGVVAMIVHPEIPRLSEDEVTEWKSKNEAILILDRIGNANNLGAIVRSAAFFGITNLVIPMDEAQSTINTSTYRVAQGGMEFMHIYSVASIPRLLQSLENQYARIGTDVRTKKTVSDLPSIITKDGKKMPVALILGNEETGISDEIKSLCDALIRIPGKPFYTDSNGVERAAIESLNVAQSAAILLHEIGKL